MASFSSEYCVSQSTMYNHCQNSLSAVFWEVCLGCCDSPFISSFIRLHLSGKDLEHKVVLASSFLPTNATLSSRPSVKRNVIRTFSPSMVLDKSFYHKNFITDLAVRTEVDVWIFTAGWADIIKLDFSRARFLEVACLDLEALALKREDKFLQLLDLFFFFLLASFI